MNRRAFVKSSLVTGSALALGDLSAWGKVVIKRQKLTSAYYLRAGMFTQVPKNLKRDLDLMKKWDTDIVCISVHYMQLIRAGINVERIVREVKDRGMQLYIIPARVAGLTAASPIVSFFTAYHPEVLSLKKDGTPHLRANQGAMGSFYHPETIKYVTNFGLKVLENWDVDGIVWDEPKCTWWQDFSPLALLNNPEGDFRTYIRDMAAFFSDVNQKLKEKKPSLQLLHFDEAVRNEIVVEESAKIAPLDYFGCDGKPWPGNLPADGKGTPKNLFINGQRYLNAAHRENTGSFYLVENFNLNKEKTDLMERYLPKVIEKDVDMLGYYFYGSGLEEPERVMKITAKNLKAFKKN
jgi:hypothetical protein